MYDSFYVEDNIFWTMLENSGQNELILINPDKWVPGDMYFFQGPKGSIWSSDPAIYICNHAKTVYINLQDSELTLPNWRVI